MNSQKHSPPKVIITMSIRPELAKILTDLAKENALSRSQFIEYLVAKSLLDSGYISEDELPLTKETEVMF